MGKIKIFVLFIIVTVNLMACAGYNKQAAWKDTRRALPADANDWEKLKTEEFTLVKFFIPYILAEGESGATAWRAIIQRGNGDQEAIFIAKLLVHNPKFDPTNPTAEPALTPLLAEVTDSPQVAVGFINQKLKTLLAEDAKIVILANSGQHCVKPGTNQVFSCPSLDEEYFDWEKLATSFKDIAFSPGKESGIMAFPMRPGSDSWQLVEKGYATAKNFPMAQDHNFSGPDGEWETRKKIEAVDGALHAIKVIVPTLGTLGLVWGLGSPATTAALSAGVTGLVATSGTLLAVFTQPEYGSEYLNSFVTNYSLALVKLKMERLIITVQELDERLKKLEAVVH